MLERVNGFFNKIQFKGRSQEGGINRQYRIYRNGKGRLLTFQWLNMAQCDHLSLHVLHLALLQQSPTWVHAHPNPSFTPSFMALINLTHPLTYITPPEIAKALWYKGLWVYPLLSLKAGDEKKRKIGTSLTSTWAAGPKRIVEDEQSEAVSAIVWASVGLLKESAGIWVAGGWKTNPFLKDMCFFIWIRLRLYIFPNVQGV